jgi:hypothetical protein
MICCKTYIRFCEIFPLSVLTNKNAMYRGIIESLEIVSQIVSENEKGDLLRDLCLILNQKYQGDLVPESEPLLQDILDDYCFNDE